MHDGQMKTVWLDRVLAGVDSPIEDNDNGYNTSSRYNIA